MTENKKIEHLTIHEIKALFRVSRTLLDEIKELLGFTTVRYFSADQVEQIREMIGRINHAWRPLTEENLSILKHNDTVCVFMLKNGYKRSYFLKKYPQNANGWFFKVMK